MFHRLLRRTAPWTPRGDPVGRFLTRVAELSDDEWLRVSLDRRTIPRVADVDTIGKLVAASLVGDRAESIETLWRWCREHVSEGALRARRRWLFERPDFTPPEDLVRDAMSAAAGIVLADKLPPGGLALLYGPFRGAVPSATIGLTIEYPAEPAGPQIHMGELMRRADDFINVLYHLGLPEWTEILRALPANDPVVTERAWTGVLLPRAQAAYPSAVPRIASQAILIASRAPADVALHGQLAHAIVRATLAGIYRRWLAPADYAALVGPFRALVERSIPAA